jgi:hypothetical protein
MMLGGFVSAADRRFRVKRDVEVATTVATKLQESQA